MHQLFPVLFQKCIQQWWVLPIYPCPYLGMKRIHIVDCYRKYKFREGVKPCPNGDVSQGNSFHDKLTIHVHETLRAKEHESPVHSIHLRSEGHLDPTSSKYQHKINSLQIHNPNPVVEATFHFDTSTIFPPIFTHSISVPLSP